MSPHTPGPTSETITCPSCNRVVSFTSEFGTSTTCVLHAAAQELLAFVEALRAATKITRVFGPEDVAFWARESEAAIRKATAP